MLPFSGFRPPSFNNTFLGGLVCSQVDIMGSKAVDFDSYFASTNSLAFRFIQEKTNVMDSMGNKWHRLSNDEQNRALNYHYYGGETAQGPAAGLKVYGGEKIVIDFDKEGWTWRDEHSGPFSWMTRSQEDLTIEEIFSDKAPPKSPKLKMKPQSNLNKISLSNDSGNSSHIRNSPFMAADRGENVSFKGLTGEKSFADSDDVSQRCGESVLEVTAQSTQGSMQDSITEASSSSSASDEKQTGILDIFLSNDLWNTKVVQDSLQSSQGSGKFSNARSDIYQPLPAVRKTGSSTLPANVHRAAMTNIWPEECKPRPEKSQAEKPCVIEPNDVVTSRNSTGVSDYTSPPSVYIEQPKESSDFDIFSSIIKPTDSAVLSGYAEKRSISTESQSAMETFDSQVEPSDSSLLEDDSMQASGSALKTGFEFLDNW